MSTLLNQLWNGKYHPFGPDIVTPKMQSIKNEIAKLRSQLYDTLSEKQHEIFEEHEALLYELGADYEEMGFYKGCKFGLLLMAEIITDKQ